MAPIGRSGSRGATGVGFLAQQPYYNIFSVDSGPFIFRPPLKGLPEQPFPPNAFQSWTYQYNLNLIGQDRLPVGDQWTVLPPAQVPYELTRNFTWQWPFYSLYLSFVGRNLNVAGVIHDELPAAYSVPYRIDQTWAASYNKNLVGKDLLPVGDQITELVPRPAPRLTDYSWTQTTTALTLPRPPVTNAVFRGVWKSLPEQPFRPEFTWIESGNVYYQVTPQNQPFSQDDWPNPQQPWRLDQTWTWQYNKNLIGKDKLPIGEQVYDLVPSQRPPEQIQLHAWSWSYNLNLIGRDRMIVGDQVTDLAPSQRTPEQTQLHSWQWSYNLNLRGKDQLPIGEQVSDLPPRDPREPRTWSWSYNQNLIGQDRMLVGDQFWERPTLPILPAQTWIQSVSYEEIAKPFAQYDWPNPTAPYRIEQTWSWSYNLNLIGQDKLPIGAELTEPAPRDFSRLLQTWIQQTNLALLTTPPSLMPRKGITDWPVPIAPPRPDETWTWQYNLNLIGQDQLPIRQQDWPNPIPPATLRDWIQQTNLALLTVVTKPFAQTDWPNPTPPSRLDQTWTWQYNKNLIGKDQLPIGAELSDLPPRDPREVRSWAWWYNLDLVGQDQLPFRQMDWPLTPAAQRQIDLATWIDRVKWWLLTPFHQTDWPNPTQPFRDPTLGTIARGYNLDLLGQDRLPNRQQDWPLPQTAEYTLLRAWLLPLNIGLLAPPALTLPLTSTRISDRPQLRPDVPADLYTITHSQQIPQPTPTVTPAVYNKPMLAGPGYLDVIPGEKPS